MRAYKFLVVLSITLLATTAYAQVPQLAPLNYQMKYDVTWGGLSMGRVRVTISEDEFGYKMSVDTKTKGIARLFDNTKSIIETRGRVTDGAYTPQRYESSTVDSEDGRTTKIIYESDGSIRSRDRNPPDDPNRRPVVPLEQANRGVDPLTAFLKLRQKMRDNMERNIRDTSVRTYDGARLGDLTLKVVSRASLENMDQHVNAINTVLTRQPIAGYKDKEITKYEKGDPLIHVYYSADDRFIPLQIEIKLSLGTVVLKLSEIDEVK
jgi:hypothetical protein